MNDIEQYIKGTQDLLTKQAAVYEKNAPRIVDKLIALGLVKNSSRQAAITSLHSPQLVMETLNSLLDSSLAGQSRSSVSSLGAPVKLASTKIVANAKKESDVNFEKYFLPNN